MIISSDGGEGYDWHFAQLRDAIIEKCPEATVTGAEGERASFEITVNGTLIYSKKHRDSFPDGEQVVAYCRDVAESGDSMISVEPIDPEKSCTVVGYLIYIETKSLNILLIVD